MESAELKSKYVEIFLANGITDEIDKVIAKVPEYLIGEQTGSICELVTVYFKDEAKSPQQLFVKKILPTTSTEVDKIALVESVMRNEGTFLTTFVNEMKIFCEEKLGADNDIGVQHLFPKTYFASVQEIIMENVTGVGYFMFDKTQLQNFEIARKVLQSLAKFHAVSHCLIQKEGGKQTFLEKYPNFNEMMFTPAGADMISTLFEPIVESVIKLLNENQAQDSLAVAEKLATYKGRVASSFCDILRLPSLFDVVNHGDLWNNNMMFSPETKESPELAKLVFVDFQTMRAGSPCLDIAHYIFISTQPEVRKRSKELLKIYFDAVSELIKKLGGDFPHTFEDFLLEYGLKSRMELFYGIITPIALEAIKNYDPSTSDGTDEGFAKMMEVWLQNSPENAGAIMADVKQKVADFEMFGQL